MNDRMISYYRSYFRTKKWTVRMFEHFVDFIVVNLWISKRKKEQIENIDTSKLTTLLDFKLELGKELCSYTAVAAEYTDNDSETEAKVPEKKRKVLDLPSNLKRFDRVGHLPRYVEAKNASRCRLSSCSKKTHTMCIKCHVYVCIGKTNCFETFHSK